MVEHLVDLNEVTFEQLREKEGSVYNPRKLSEFVEAGGVGAAILSESGKIYTGVCIDTACSMGFCAETRGGGGDDHYQAKTGIKIGRGRLGWRDYAALRALPRVYQRAAR